jgi:hypothetical protein
MTLKCSRCARPTAKPALVSGSIVLGPTCFRLAGLAHAIAQAAKAPRVRVSGRKDAAQLLLWARAETPQDGEPCGAALTPDPVADAIAMHSR